MNPCCFCFSFSVMCENVYMFPFCVIAEIEPMTSAGRAW